jgi:hypothetical protein
MTMSAAGARVRWDFIHSARSDLGWYLGSSLAGWLYVVLVLLFGRGLADPMRDPFYRVRFFGLDAPLTLGLLVVASWALLVDAPHVWATLARTWLDPDDWTGRRGILLASLGWFALGRAVVFAPYLLGTLVPLAPRTMALPAVVFFVFFRLWAYYHVVRQHWGFLVLYKRRNDDFRDSIENRADLWFFNAALYLPLVSFLTAPWYEATGLPPLGLDRPLVGTSSIGSFVHPAALGGYAIAVVSYLLFQVLRYRRGMVRNGPKLLLFLAVCPLHLAVFSHPLLALFVVPVVTVGHNLQYHRIVWVFGRHKYTPSVDPSYRFARAAFRSIPVYLALGLLFTFLLYQGPLVQWIQASLSHAFDRWVFGGIALVAGVARPEQAGVGARVASTLFLGWAMQHYYLDSKIWRVRRDPGVARHLSV